ncbi:hypothetical protein J6590_021062 [Homalodisca vitripennis]|nr:hypothetical protein J6590_021062 [Homalodisca vitripennis]
MMRISHKPKFSAVYSLSPSLECTARAVHNTVPYFHQGVQHDFNRLSPLPSPVCTAFAVKAVFNRLR